MMEPIYEATHKAQGHLENLLAATLPLTDDPGLRAEVAAQYQATADALQDILLEATRVKISGAAKDEWFPGNG